MTIAVNERAPISFRVCEDAEGNPYIGTRENGPNTNSILNERTSLYFGLFKGTDMEEAEKIVAFLNANISSVGLTVFDNATFQTEVKG